MKEVTIFSTPSCHFCHMAKDYFDEKGVKYTDYNVAENMEKRAEMVEMTGQLGVPVILIGTDAIVGFDKTKVNELLGITD